MAELLDSVAPQAQYSAGWRCREGKHPLAGCQVFISTETGSPVMAEVLFRMIGYSSTIWVDKIVDNLGDSLRDRLPAEAFSKLAKIYPDPSSFKIKSIRDCFYLTFLRRL
jgi:hypothetical protein